MNSAEGSCAATSSTNSSAGSVTARQLVPHQFDQCAAATPNALAVTADSQTLTYSELEQRATRLALQLRSLGVGPNVLVGLFVDRSVEFITGALSILKAGGAYVPLDPSLPRERLRAMLQDAQPPVVVAHSRTREALPSYTGELITLDAEVLERGRDAFNSSETVLEASDLAYVIYTSGSTGEPKGVEITHGGLLNLVNWHQRTFEITSGERASHQAPIGFDAAVWEIWPYLAAGAAICLPPEKLAGQPERFRDWLIAQRITITFVVTPLAEHLLSLTWPSDVSLRILLTGADTLHQHPSAELPFKLVNNYGPTECTVVATSGVVAADEGQIGLPSIGRPIDNTQIYILDREMREVPEGEAGEICIGGAGLARGYINRPVLTAERFVSKTFSNGSETRLYRTGDLGRFLPDGQIAFLGRQDEQIKIRGYRIEPDEIVCQLDAHPAVQTSAVIAREDAAGEKQLVAYVVLAADAAPQDLKLREFLSERLPEYMVPAAFVRLDTLPLTPNGKIDRATLPPPDSGNLLRHQPSVAPRTPIEERLIRILTPLLRVEKIGLNDNFFFLGGHSLLGTQLVTRINRTFNVEMTLLNLFEHPTVAEIAAEVERLVAVRAATMGSGDLQRGSSMLESGQTG